LQHSTLTEKGIPIKVTLLHQPKRYTVGIPVCLAKGGSDRHAAVQTQQDIAYCATKFPNLICRAVSAQFMSGDRIAMFELVLQDDEIRVAEEKHYQLVSSASISLEDLQSYRSLGQS
jgi:hypothetical protein